MQTGLNRFNKPPYPNRHQACVYVSVCLCSVQSYSCQFGSLNVHSENELNLHKYFLFLCLSLAHSNLHVPMNSKILIYLHRPCAFLYFVCVRKHALPLHTRHLKCVFACELREMVDTQELRRTKKHIRLILLGSWLFIIKILFCSWNRRNLVNGKIFAILFINSQLCDERANNDFFFVKKR